MKALHSLQARNDQARGMLYGPPWRVRANGSLSPEVAAAPRCILPASTLAQAALYMQQGQPQAGMALLERLNTTVNNALRAPWQLPLAFRADTGQADGGGQASVTGAADWNLLYALEGFTFNAQRAQMTLVPQMPGTWRSLSAPLFAPTFWGSVEFKPTARGGVLTLHVDRLVPLLPTTAARTISSSPNLILRSLRVPGPPPRSGPAETAPPVVYASLGRVPVGSHAILEAAGTVLVTFDAPLSLAAGDLLEVTVH